MKKQHVVKLTDIEIKELREYIHSGNHTARNIARAQILLLASENKTDEEIAKSLHVCKATVYNTRRRYHEENKQSTINGYASAGRPPKLDEKAEATLIAIACSKAPEGYSYWTMHMIADKMVELKAVDSLSAEAVRLHLKKAKLNPGRESSGASAN